MQPQRLTQCFFCFLLLITGCSGLAGELEIVRTLPPRSTAVPENFTQLVNLESGAAIYAENCVRCHGIGGAGDGELVANGQVGDIPDFRDPATIQAMSPQAWFDVITHGRLEKLMPPWQDSLSASQRWNVAFYTYTLSYDEAAVAQGEVLYQANCASCHGEEGAGTADAPALIGLLEYSESALQQRLAEHESEVELVSTLSEAERSAAVQYLRLLSSTTRSLPTAVASVANAPTSEAPVQSPMVTEAVAIPADATTSETQTIGRIHGQIRQGTEGGTPVTGLEAVLHVVDSQFREQVAEFIVGEDGSYFYEEVVMRSDFAYLITVNRDNVRFTSQIAIGDPTVTDLELNVTVYEPTEDPSVVTITSRATQFNLTAQGLYVIEVIDMVNRSDRMFVEDRMEEGYGPVSVSIPLPEGAQLQQEHTNTSRFAVSENGSELLDRRPVLPGTEHYIQFSYSLPYSDSLAIPMPIGYAVDGPIAFYVEASHLQLEGEGIEFVRDENFNGDRYRVYQVAQTPAIGDTVRYRVDIALPEGAPTTDEAAGISRETLAGILVAGGAVFVAAALYLRRRPARPTTAVADDNELTAEEIMVQIAHLDNRFDAGEIDQTSYEAERNRLKTVLVQKMKQAGGTRR